MSSDLGCEAEWDWMIRRRTGETVARPESNAWSLRGDRRLSATSEAQLVVAPDCCESIDDVETGDELVLYRERQVVWYGVAKKDTAQAPDGSVVIDARDRTWWLRGRFFAFLVDWTGRDAGLNLRDLLAANAAVDPLTALTWYDPPADYLLGQVLSIATTLTTHFDLILQSLAESVLDFTVIGDKMLVGLEGTGVAPLPLLSGESWDDGLFTRVQDHDLYANEIVVDGKDDLVAYWPPLVTTPPFAPTPNPRWGNRKVRISDSLLSDYASCLVRAQAEYSVRFPPQRRIAVPNGALVDERVSFGQLIPGAECVVQAPATCTATTLISMLVATVSWEVSSGTEDAVKLALVEKGQPLAAA